MTISDFSNGVLVAMIFDRYYPGQMQINTLYSGDSIDRKLNNWDVIYRFFCRNGILISREMIDDVLYCKDGEAVDLIEKIYVILTNRPANNIVTVESQPGPHYTTKTASHKLREIVVTPDHRMEQQKLLSRLGNLRSISQINI